MEQEQSAFRRLLVCNKIDLLVNTNKEIPEDSTFLTNTKTLENETGLQPYFTSCVEGMGLSDLEEGIKREISLLLNQSTPSSPSTQAVESVLITRERHRGHVKRCINHLDRFLSGKLPMDAAAEELRLAMMEMGKVTGRVDVEELLDIIFRDFCIGK